MPELCVDPDAKCQATALPSIETQWTSLLLAIERSKPTLLTLPCEIRNRKYDFTAEAGTILIHRSDYPYDNKWIDIPPENRPQHLALIQACRQIRAEFLNLYKARTTVCIRPEFNEYINIFVKSDDVKDEDLVGKILIDFGIWKGQYVNVKPMLELIHKSEKLSVEVRGIRIRPEYPCYKRSFQDLVDAALNTYNPTLFHAYLNEAIHALDLRCVPDKHGKCWIYEVTLAINIEHWKTFMRFRSTLDYGIDPSDHKYPQMKEWSQISGMLLKFECPSPGCYIAFKQHA